MSRNHCIATFLIALLAAPVLFAQSEGGDPYPAGAIAFFNLPQCPAGWSLETTLAGRTIVPMDSKGGTTVGAPLASGENPMHMHYVNAAVSVADTSYFILDGKSTNIGNAGTFGLSGQLRPASSNIPYVQLLACRKTGAAVADVEPPRDIITFTESGECADRWTVVTSVAGRYLVGLPQGGTAHASFGGKPLAAGEARTHAHDIAGSFTLESEPVGAGSGCCNTGFAKQGTYSYRGTTSNGYAGLPYMHLRPCSPR